MMSQFCDKSTIKNCLLSSPTFKINKLDNVIKDNFILTKNQFIKKYIQDYKYLIMIDDLVLPVEISNDGYGVISLENNDYAQIVYEGYIHNNLPHGHGKEITFCNHYSSSIYITEGQYKNGIKYGDFMVSNEYMPLHVDIYIADNVINVKPLYFENIHVTYSMILFSILAHIFLLLFGIQSTRTKMGLLGILLNMPFLFMWRYHEKILVYINTHYKHIKFSYLFHLVIFAFIIDIWMIFIF